MWPKTDIIFHQYLNKYNEKIVSKPDLSFLAKNTNAVEYNKRIWITRAKDKLLCIFEKASE